MKSDELIEVLKKAQDENKGKNTIHFFAWVERDEHSAIGIGALSQSAYINFAKSLIDSPKMKAAIQFALLLEKKEEGVYVK